MICRRVHKASIS